MKRKIMKITKETKKYLLYHLRWQISAVVMYPVMAFLQSLGLPLWANLSLGQMFGAIIFWKVDQWIFKHPKEVQEIIEEV